jgi:rubrerythrin
LVAAGIDVPRQESELRLVAGAKAKGEYRCVGCGYGISISSKLPRCPMCGTESWEQLQWGFGPLRSDN